MKKLTILLVLMCSPAFCDPAAEKKPDPYATHIDGVEIAHYYELVVHSDVPGQHAFHMGRGACLRGPLEFFDNHGRIRFRLDPNVTFPTGCDK